MLTHELDARGFWQPDVTVATVVEADGRLLVVEESIRGEVVLNQPAGHLDPGESLLEAAVRETLEETAWEVALTHGLGTYQWQAPDGRHYLRFAFAARPLRHHPDRALDTGILRALWMTPAELAAAAPRHRSPLVARTVADYLAGARIGLEHLRTHP